MNGVSLLEVLEHWRTEEILEEAKVEAIEMVMKRRRLDLFEHAKRRIQKSSEQQPKCKEIPYRKTQVEMEGHCRKGQEGLVGQEH